MLMATHKLGRLVKVLGTYSSVCKLVFTVRASARVLAPVSPILLRAKLCHTRNTNNKRQELSSADEARERAGPSPNNAVWLPTQRYDTKCWDPTKCVFSSTTSEKPMLMATHKLVWFVGLHGTYESVCKLVFALSASATAMMPLSPILLSLKL
jgi:hypothetical protein